jgi:Xaa-Pro aminopeptidase
MLLSMNRIIAVTAAAFALSLTLAAPSAAQTAEQRYADWATPVFPFDEYEGRRDQMLQRLAAQAEGGDGGILLIPSADGSTHGGTFRQLDDFSYFTGLELPGSMLVLDGYRGLSLLFLPPRDARFEDPGRRNDFPGRPLGDDPAVLEMAGVDGTFDVAELPGALAEWAAAGRTLLVNAGRGGEIATPQAAYFGSLDATEMLILKLREDLPGADIGNAFPLIARTRMVKQPVEVASMRRAADATMAAIALTAAAIRPGVDERTLQGIFEAACRAHGAAAIPFTPIIKSGPNSLWPWRVLAAHYDRRNRVMEDGDLVILDVGCEVNGYISDVGRTFPVNARFTMGQADILGISTRAADAIIAAARPGVTLAELTAIAYEAIPDSQEKYMQTPSYFGHHIGLSSGDPALMDVPLEPGMVFTVEPWYYNHDRDIAVFVEDVILITEDGAGVLTRSLPRSPQALERLIR